MMLENGIIYGSLKEAIHRYPDLVARYLGKNAPMKNETFVSLNTAFSQDGIFLYVPEGMKMEKPIQIIHLLLSDKNQMVHHRNLFVVEKNAAAQVIICDHTLSPHMFLTNSVTEAFTGENADLDILRLAKRAQQLLSGDQYLDQPGAQFPLSAWNRDPARWNGAQQPACENGR